MRKQGQRRLTARDLASGVLGIFVIVEVVSGCGLPIGPRNPPLGSATWHFPRIEVTKANSHEGSVTQPEIKLRVLNAGTFPETLFARQTALPPCEPGGYSSTLKAEAFAGDNTLLWTGCGFRSARDLRTILITLPAGKPAPRAVYLRLTDRGTGEAFTSDQVPLPR